MADVTILNGTDVIMFFSPTTGTTDWTAAAHATSHTLSLSRSERNTSNKGTGDMETSEYGRLSISATLNGMAIDDDKYNYEDFAAAIVNKTPLLLIFGKKAGTTDEPDTTTGGKEHFYASGIFIIISMEISSPDAENVTYTVNLKHKSDFQLNSLVTT